MRKQVDFGRWIAFLSLVLLLGCSLVRPDDDLPLCTRYQACGARLNDYPLLVDTVGEMVEELGSGSSGEEAEQPLLYDEFVTAKTPFDFNAEPTTHEKRLCRCEQEEEDSNACSYDAAENLIALDPKRLTLAFCQPIGENVRLRCVGRNHFRVMGKLSEDGETLAEVTDVAAFCKCPAGFYQQRPQIEPWIDGSYVFTYNCQR